MTLTIGWFLSSFPEKQKGLLDRSIGVNRANSPLRKAAFPLLHHPVISRANSKTLYSHPELEMFRTEPDRDVSIARIQKWFSVSLVHFLQR